MCKNLMQELSEQKHWAIELLHVCSHNIVEKKANFVLKCPSYNTVRKIILCMFQNVSVCTLKSNLSITVEDSPFHFE